MRSLFSQLAGDTDSTTDAESKTPRDPNKEHARTGQAEMTVPTNPIQLIKELGLLLSKVQATSERSKVCTAELEPQVEK
jgi:hypothetical protein